MKKELSALVRVKESQTMHSIVHERVWAGQAAEQAGARPSSCRTARSVQTPDGCKVALTWQRNNLAVDVAVVLPGGRRV